MATDSSKSWNSNSLGSSSPTNETRPPRFPAVSEQEYEKLLRMAAALHWRCPSWTLNPTALVHSALLKLHAWPNLPPSNDPHFMAVAARAMRQILVDRARKRLNVKHGGELRFVPLTEQAGTSELSPVEFLDLNRALDELAEMNSRHAQVFEYMTFWGYTVEQAAALLGVAARTIQRDIRVANAWIASRVRNGAEK